MDDIENPFIHYLITNFLENRNLVEARNSSKILFKMNDEEFDKYLDQKDWYETK
jgi:hypothetical protein